MEWGAGVIGAEALLRKRVSVWGNEAAASGDFAIAVYASGLSQVTARTHTHTPSKTASIASGVPRLLIVLPALICGPASA